jgi:hypothetical protein
VPTTLETLLIEVNAHLPDGLKLVPPVTRKALRYARSCLAYTYKSESVGGDEARVLGPLNHSLDKIEELAAKAHDAAANATTPPPKPPPPKTEPPKPPPPPKAEPRPSSSASQSSSSSSQSSSQSSSSSSSPRDERWRQARDDETPAERAFREALEEVERKNREKQAGPAAADVQRLREALDVVEQHFRGDLAALGHVQELRKALVASLEQRRKAS